LFAVSRTKMRGRSAAPQRTPMWSGQTIAVGLFLLSTIFYLSTSVVLDEDTVDTLDIERDQPPPDPLWDSAPPPRVSNRAKTAPPGAAGVLKVYGVQHTGTRAALGWFLTSFDIKLYLIGNLGAVADVRGPIHPVLKDLQSKYTTERNAKAANDTTRGGPYMVGSADDLFRDYWKYTLGWKHQTVDSPSELKRRMKDETEIAPSDLRAVVMLRHPYTWLPSMFKDPCEWGRRGQNFTEFISMDSGSIRGAKRDNFLPKSYGNLTEFFVTKNRAFAALGEEFSVFYLPMEALLNHEDVVKKDVMKKFGFLAGNTTSKYGYSKSSADKKRDENASEKWKEHFTQEDLDLVNAAVDWDFVGQFGYKPIKSLHDPGGLEVLVPCAFRGKPCAEALNYGRQAIT